MKRLSFAFALLLCLCSVMGFAQVTLLDGFEEIPGTAGWRTTMNSGTSGQNINVADGGTLTASTDNVTQGSGSGMISLNWDKPSVDSGTSPWPGTDPVWGCRWFTSSGADLGYSPLGDTLKIDVYNDTGDAIKFSLLVKDQSGSGDYINGPYVTLSPGANAYEFIPETEGSIWIATGNGVMDGNVAINSLLFYSDDEPANASNVFYVDNLRREGAQTDTTPPDAPLLKAVKLKAGTTNQVEVSWFANTEADLDGYRLYTGDDFNIVGNAISWDTAPILDENTLDKNAVSATVSIDAGSTVTFFKLTALDNATPSANESMSGQPLAVKLTGTEQAPQVLCVMDLQRFQPGDINWGAYEYRSFIAFLAYALEQLDEPFISATAEGVVMGAVDLTPSSYKMVAWSTGVDGNNTDTSAVSPTAISDIVSFLMNKGRFFLSGTYIATSLNEATGGSSLLSMLGISPQDQTGGNIINIPSGSIFSSVTADLKTDDQWNYAAYASAVNNNLIVGSGGSKELEFDGASAYAAAASVDSNYKAVTCGFAFESLRQDYADSQDARAQFLGAVMDFLGLPPAPITAADSPWQLYE